MMPSTIEAMASPDPLRGGSGWNGGYGWYGAWTGGVMVVLLRRRVVRSGP